MAKSDVRSRTPARAVVLSLALVYLLSLAACVVYLVQVRRAS